MIEAAGEHWAEANQRYLMAALGVVRAALERRVRDPAQANAGAGQLQQALEAAAAAMPSPPALQRVCTVFGLSPFERELLLVCAGVELDSTFAGLCAALHGDSARRHPTFGLALATLSSPHWSALTPEAPLRRWRMIEVSSGHPLTSSALRIDERVLHYLAGIQHLDERLAGIVEPLPPGGELVPSHWAVVDRMVQAWASLPERAGFPVVQLCGNEPVAKRLVAAAACSRFGLTLAVMHGSAIPSAPAELDTLVRLWEREAALGTSGLLVDCDSIDAADTLRAAALGWLIDHVKSPLVITSREHLQSLKRPTVTLEVQNPTAAEQRRLWEARLGSEAAGLNGQVDALVSQFNLGASTISAICAEMLSSDAAGPKREVSGAELAARVWEACRGQSRPRLGDLAQRLEPSAAWDELVLPGPQRHLLREIAMHVKHRATVNDVWGFSAKSTRGLGISALFAGPSGTGKTMAAEVLAGELRLDIYRIDLSQIVSKYIGETEKNLRRVFDAAEDGGAILLFDEADALFGKRSEVKDSHDRYANIEISYLLQRMEAYRGLAILTTNMKSALDGAFLRRIRFIVQFPFPEAAQRAEIWRRVFPVSTPVEGLDPDRLARLNVAGGNIRSIALNAAFLAADAGEPVRMDHVWRAARSEYAKLEKPLAEATPEDRRDA
jgi:ATPase family associated with various cellular activities (AAA)